MSGGEEDRARQLDELQALAAIYEGGVVSTDAGVQRWIDHGEDGFVTQDALEVVVHIPLEAAAAEDPTGLLPPQVRTARCVPVTTLPWQLVQALAVCRCRGNWCRALHRAAVGRAAMLARPSSEAPAHGGSMHIAPILSDCVLLHVCCSCVAYNNRHWSRCCGASSRRGTHPRTQPAARWTATPAC